MNSVNDWFNKYKIVLLLIFAAYLFSIGLRLIWVYQFSDVESFKYNNQLMINTNDGYYFAKGAQDILNDSLVEGSRSPVNKALSLTTAFFAKILPFSFESIILYMSAFLSSLIVIPLILIGQQLKNVQMGFIAALIASVAWSYYNRTMTGYYDTDMLNIVLPVVLLWSLIGALESKKNIYLLIIALDAFVYRWWYPQSYALEFAFIGLMSFYVGYLYYKKQDITYFLKLITLMLLATLLTYELLRLVAIFALFYFFTTSQSKRFVPYTLAVIVSIFWYLGGLDPIIGQLKSYVFRQSVSADINSGLGLHFFGVMQTVKEASAIPFELFANRISGHVVTFVLSIIGYGWLVYKHKVMLLALPMLGLGFLAYGIPGVIDPGGLRFTIYAVPVAAIGLAFLITQTTSYFRIDALKYIAYAGLVILALLPNIAHIKNYKVPTVFNSLEVDVLTILNKQANENDYTLAWWDYGYPIMYYSNTLTLIDGGKHRGASNYPVSYVLTQPQKKAAYMARLGVEYELKNKAIQEKNKVLPKDEKRETFSTIEAMTKDYGYKNTNAFLHDIESLKLPQATRDIYLYLPLRMSGLYRVINYFSNIDLMSGQKYQEPIFYESGFIQQEGDFVNFGNGIVLDKKNALLIQNSKTQRVKRFIKTAYAKDNKLIKQVQNISNEGLNIVFLESYNKVMVIDDSVYDSLYFQLFFLENYDKTLFEKVIDSPLAKVYKLKI